LISQTIQIPAEASQALTLLRHHLGRRAGDETFVRELRLGLGDLALQTRDLLAEPLEFGRHIDAHLQREPQVPRERHR
jgi:hypothetical protein